MPRNTAIPTRSRELVLSRQLGLCFGCGAKLSINGGEWAHRRTRAVVDGHTMCPCNGLYLCTTCHQWSHANPLPARQKGWIVSRHTPDPSVVGAFGTYGWVLLNHEGGFSIDTERVSP